MSQGVGLASCLPKTAWASDFRSNPRANTCQRPQLRGGAAGGRGQPLLLSRPTHPSEGAYLLDKKPTRVDKACHAYGGKKTPRVEPLYGKPGIAYVYFIYGMYYCFNIITKEEGSPEGVLIRAVEPLEGFDVMSELRFKKNYKELSNTQKRDLTNGPGKLCMAFGITKENTWDDLTNDEELYVEEPPIQYDINDFKIVETTRIGIDYAEEARDFLWRFYIKENRYISKL